MVNRFRDPTMKRCYDACVEAYKLKHKDLFHADGSRHQGNSIASFFWRGFDSITLGGPWNAVSKKMMGYAYWRAGQDMAAEEKKSKK